MRKAGFCVAHVAMMFVVNALLSCGGNVPGSSAGPAKSAVVPGVKAAPVQEREFRRQVETVGSLYPHDEVTVSSEVEGRAEEVMVDVGDRVKRGDPLVKIAPVELQLALAQQKAYLRQARARLGVPEEGPDLQDVRTAAEVKRGLADRDDADQKFQRAKALMDQGLLPQQSYDEAEAKLKSARAAYDLAVQTVENLRALVSQYQTGVALAEKKLSDAVIRAPFDGRVKERAVTQGQYLKVQAPVAVVVNTDPMRVRLKIPEKMASHVRVGLTVSFTVDAYADRTFTAVTSRINPSVDPQTRSFEVEASTPNQDDALKPGFFVKARIPSDQVEVGLFVPYASLQYIYGIYKVFAIDKDTLKEKDVKIGERSGEWVEILGGLAPGEVVAVPEPGQVLRDRLKVRVQN